MAHPVIADVVPLSCEPQRPFNPGIPFAEATIDEVQVDRAAVDEAAALIAGRAASNAWGAAWLVRVLQCIDLTTLNADDTDHRVRALAAKAARPLRDDLRDALGLGEQPLTTAAVCVYPRFLDVARQALAGTGVPVAVVAADFPSGLAPFPERIAEVEACAAAGADEIDVVIAREHVLTGSWRALYDEVRAMKDACGAIPMKTILATGELKTLDNVARASWVAMMAGSDFIKTSTGKEAVNATLLVALTMVRAVRAYRETTGSVVGFKPAGGISTAKAALAFALVVEKELGSAWLQPGLFRIGASSLLADIERQLEHCVSHGSISFDDGIA